jgi:hypothetical protein
MQTGMAPRRAVLAAGLLALALAAPAHAVDCPGADATPAAQGPGPTGAATVCLLNAERAARGLRPLAPQDNLTWASQGFADLMVGRAFFAHETPEGVDLVARLNAARYLGAGVDDWVVGENLAWGQGPLSTPRAIVAAWMASDGHRENVLSREFDEIGIGVTAGTPLAGPDGATYATDFGARSVAQPSRPRSRSAGRAAARRAAAERDRRARRSRARRTAHRARAARAASPRGRHGRARRGVLVARVVRL